MVKFNTTTGLGDVATLVSAYSFGVDPITSFDDIIFAGGGNKFSTTCGFRFKSKLKGHPKPEFNVTFCTKFRSNIYHQVNTNPSKWFIFQQPVERVIQVLDKRSCLDEYGFDITLFLDSDMFNKYTKLFQDACKNGLTIARKFVADTENQREDDKHFTDKDDPKINALHAIDAIQNSLELIPTKIFNNKKYLLHNFDKPTLS